MGDKVQCISLDIDFYGSKRKSPEFFRDDVVKIIQSVGAKFTTYVSSTPDEEVYAKIGFSSIPAVLVYDANGKLVKKFADLDSGFTYHKDIIPYVSGLLK